jgi:hypothetical protein
VSHQCPATCFFVVVVFNLSFIVWKSSNFYELRLFLFFIKSFYVLCLWRNALVTLQLENILLYYLLILA